VQWRSDANSSKIVETATKFDVHVSTLSKDMASNFNSIVSILLFNNFYILFYFHCYIFYFIIKSQKCV